MLKLTLIRLLRKPMPSVLNNGNPKPESVSIFHATKDIRNANSPQYHCAVMGDTFIVNFVVS